MIATGTYVYCVVAAARRPAVPRLPARTSGLRGLGPLRLLAITPPKAVNTAMSGRLSLWAVVANAPLDAYSEDAINQGLTDLDWVSRAAVAHEAVVESFSRLVAVLPMKLFTIFKTDERALAHLARQYQQMQTVAIRVRGQHEWGIRVVLDRVRAVSAPLRGEPAQRTTASGAGYLQRKKAQHDATAELAARSREIVGELFEGLARQATQATRRSGGALPAPGAPLLLDAAYLVPRTRTRSFQAAVTRQAKALRPQGYVVTLTGPWPPYTFMQD